MRVSVVGEERFTLGFKLAGVNAAYELSEEDFRDEVDDIVEDEEGVVIVAHDHMRSLPERKRMELQNAVDPVVIPVGGEEGGDDDLRTKIKQAIGVDLWSDD